MSSIQTSVKSDLETQEIQRLVERPKTLSRIYKEVLKVNLDYGTIPGIPKPSLWKPGAELLGIYFKLSSGDPIIERTENLDKPYFAYVVQQRFFRDGHLVGVGVGAANTGETRYAFKKVWDPDYNRMTDEEKEKCVKRKGSWYLPTPPDEIFTLQNTVLKMAKKRAFVDGILAITGADRIFSQDMDEENESARIKDAKSVTPQKSGTLA